MSEPEGDFASVESDGFTVTSSTETPEQLQTNLAEPAPAEPDLSKAGAELGKAGGEATAAKKAAEVEPEPTEAEKLGKPRHDPKARMLEATREAAELKRQNAAITAERERLAAEVARLSAGKTAEPEKPKHGDDDPEPDLNAFEDWNEGQKALARWAARQEFRSAQQKQQISAEATQYWTGVSSQAAQFNDRLSKAAEADPTFYERTQHLADFLQTSFQAEMVGQQPTIKNLISDEIFSSEHAPALMLHFTAHPDELQRIASLGTPRGIAREMAKLEEKLGAAPTATVPKPNVSKAHDPVRPVAGAPPIATEVPSDETPYEEHKRYYDALDRKKAASRR